MNRDLVREVGRRCPDQRIATIDQDATTIGSRKQETALAVWAEMNLVPGDR